MIQNLFFKLGLMGTLALLLFSCGEAYIDNEEPTTREKLIGVWSNYHLGTYEFSCDGIFMYEVSKSDTGKYTPYDVAENFRNLINK